LNHPTAKPHAGNTNGGAKDAPLKIDAPWPHAPKDAAQAEYDALADLFLSPETPGSTDVLGSIGIVDTPQPASIVPAPSSKPQPAAGAKPVHAEVVQDRDTIDAAPHAVVEALILGHLPVLFSAWAAQYTRTIAETTGRPVALARVQEGILQLEVVFPTAEAAASADAIAPSTDVAEALALAVRLAPRIAIRVDETSEIDLLSGNGADRATLLTGADDLAVVAAYRTIKHICLDAPGAVCLPGDDSSPRRAPVLGVAVMGADAEKARAADQKIRRATLTFLGRGLEPAWCVSRMAPCRSVLLFRGPWLFPAADLLKTIREIWSDRPQEHARPTRAAARVELSAAALSPVRSPEYAARLTGLTALSARCPYCPAVELAADAGGTLHLLAGAGGIAGRNAASDAGQAVGQLLSAASWAEDHAPLLAEAHPVLRGGQTGSGPVLHLLTDEPRSARTLLGTGVRIHLLTPVEVGGRQTWVCSDLN